MLRTDLIQELQKAAKLVDIGNFSAAKLILEKILSKNITDINALNLMGQIFLRERNYNQAISYFERSIKLNNKDPIIYYYLALMYQAIKEKQSAITAYQNSLRLNPRQGIVYKALGELLLQENEFLHSIKYLTEALRYLPKEASLHLNIAYDANSIGLTDLAMKHLKIALTMNPNDKKTIEGYLFATHRDKNSSLIDFQKYAELYYEKVLKPIQYRVKLKLEEYFTATKTTYNIGWVSADYYTHPVSIFMLNLLKGLNSEKFKIYLYYNYNRIDSTTQELESLANKFYYIQGLDDIQVANQIQNDKIDILVDLSGFTQGHRLNVFKMKPAPVQISHMGYFGTLGIPEIDYFIADPNLVKEGEESFFTEKVYKLPCCYHSQLLGIPESTTELPYKRNGFFTFGATCAFHKVSPEVLETWANILKQVPNSKLLIDAQMLRKEAHLNYVCEFFQKQGLDKDRLILQGTPKREDFLLVYNQIDLSLDAFPYGGGTTTMEALLMRVPVLTIDGDRWVGRMSTTILRNIGYEELISQSKEEYIAKAVALSNNLSFLENFKISILDDIAKSNLNIEAHVSSFEKAFIDIWEERSNANAVIGQALS